MQTLLSKNFFTADDEMRIRGEIDEQCPRIKFFKRFRTGTLKDY